MAYEIITDLQLPRTQPGRSTLPWAKGLTPILAAALGLLAQGACERDMLEPICTPIAVGQLVVTELRGPQSGVDTWGQWIELYNDSGSTLSLAGVRLRITTLSGSGELGFTVRDPGLAVGPTDRVVLGRFPRDAPPPHVDYGYLEEEDSNLPSDGIVELYVCNELVDQVIYRSLPSSGSLSLDGSLIPSAQANDDESNWCNDNVDEGGGPTDVGIPGTPGEPNRPCP
ncbi:MAG: hypothetical protein RBU30_11090 [Polyangia bacterium]|nr:hypothetical protein [Polyangia bacterium]